MFLGIDFGTCFSSVAAIGGQGIVIDGILQDDEQRTGMPSILAISDGRAVCGFECEQSQRIAEKEKIRCLKKQIRAHKKGDPLHERPDEKANDPNFRFVRKDLLEFFLQSLLEDAIRGIRQLGTVACDDRIEGVAITVPVGLGDRTLMRSDYSRALVNCLEQILESRRIRELLPGQSAVRKPRIVTLAEPVAAAIAYLKEAPDMRAGSVFRLHHSAGKLLVLDLGGGTCDVSVVSYDLTQANPVYKVVSEEGDLNLGGNDWDDALFDHINGRLFRGTLRKNDADYYRRMKSVNRIKHNLSRYETQYYQDVGGTESTLEITRAQFESVTRPLLERVKKLVRKGIGSGTVDKIVLVGGASRMPQIRSGIEALFPNVSVSYFEPSKAIAMGAAVHAENRDRAEVIIELEAQATYGVEYNDSQTHESMVNNIIFKGDKFDKDGRIRKRSIDLIPRREDQSSVWWDIYESDSMTETARRSDDFHFNGIRYSVSVPETLWKAGRAKEYSHWCFMELADSGLLELTFHDRDGKIPSSRIKRELLD